MPETKGRDHTGFGELGMKLAIGILRIEDVASLSVVWTMNSAQRLNVFKMHFETYLNLADRAGSGHLVGGSGLRHFGKCSLFGGDWPFFAGIALSVSAQFAAPSLVTTVFGSFKSQEKPHSTLETKS